MSALEHEFGDAPWKVARDQERTARQRRLDEAKQAEIELARVMPMNARPAEPVGPIGPGEEIVPETGFDRAMREELDYEVNQVAQNLASLPGPDPGTLSLEGAELVAYVRVKAASKSALELQQAYAAAGAELRAAIEAMCQLMAPPVK